MPYGEEATNDQRKKWLEKAPPNFFENNSELSSKRTKYEEDASNNRSSTYKSFENLVKAIEAEWNALNEKAEKDK
jgi:hypothetical protein